MPAFFQDAEMRPPPSIELRHLRTFITVAETQNFTHAAKQLRVSQPSISQQIKEVETALNARLFERLGTRVRLTRAGNAFRDQAKLVLRKFSEACAVVDDVEHLVFGHLDIGVIPAVNVPWIPRVLAQFASQYPGVSITIHEKPTNEIETGVGAGRFDLGIGLHARSLPGVRYERLLAESLAVIVPAGSPLLKRRVIALRELNDLAIASMPETYPMRQLVNEAFRRAKVKPKVTFETDTIEALLNVTMRTGMPTILPGIVLDGRENLGLRALKISGATPRIEFSLMWPSNGNADKATGIFVELLRQSVKPVPSNSISSDSQK